MEQAKGMWFLLISAEFIRIALGYVLPLDIRPKNSSKCPDNWRHFNNSCYYFSEAYDYIAQQDYTWQDANATCQSMGGHLVVIETEAENNFLTTRSNNSFSIGLYSLQNHGPYEWVEGKPSNYFSGNDIHGMDYEINDTNLNSR